MVNYTIPEISSPIKKPRRKRAYMMILQDGSTLVLSAYSLEDIKRVLEIGTKGIKRYHRQRAKWVYVDKFGDYKQN
jgi:hypothetical protein